ncbi:MAG: Uma2 family endonuclease, partial [Acidobacteriota bacterium]
MSTTALVSVEEYLRTSEKPNREYREGVLFPKAMPTKLRALIQYALLMLLRNQGVQPFPELTVRISPTKYLVPDVAVADDFPGDYPTEAVRVCCEILSPKDRVGTMLAKCEEYHAWGVPYCWVIDPVKRAAWEYHSSGEPTRVTEMLRAGEIAIRVQELFAALPEV